MRYPRDFTGACAYFSTQVARVHGPAVLNREEESAASTRLRVVAEAVGDAADVLEDAAMDVVVVVMADAMADATPGAELRVQLLIVSMSRTQVEPNGGRAYVMQRREAMAGRGRSGDGRGSREGRG